MSLPVRKQMLILVGAVVLAAIIAVVGARSNRLHRAVYRPVSRALLHRKLVLMVPCNALVPLGSLARRFQQDHPMVEIRKRAANHLQVLEWVRAGEYADICILPGPVEHGLLDPAVVVPGSGVVFGESKLVLVIRADLDKTVRSAADLTADKVRGIALPQGDLSTIGAFGTELLERMGVREATAAKTHSVELPMEALAMLAKRQVDVTMCTLSCPLKTMPSPDTCETHRTRIQAVAGQPLVAIEPKVDGMKHRVLWLGGVVLRRSKQPKLAEEFLRVLPTKPYQDILAEWNLSLHDKIVSPFAAPPKSGR